MKTNVIKRVTYRTKTWLS